MTKRSFHNQLNDQKLISQIKINPEAFSVIYKRCKNYCINYMRSKNYNNLDNSELEDIYDDACLVLFEKINKDDFLLTSSFQTFLNSTCINLLKNKVRKRKPIFQYENNKIKHDSIYDDFYGIENNNKELLFRIIEKAFDKIKEKKRICYELLIQFYYHNKTIQQLTAIYGYLNPDSTKNQKSKCLKEIKKIALTDLQKNYEYSS